MFKRKVDYKEFLDLMLMALIQKGEGSDIVSTLNTADSKKLCTDNELIALSREVYALSIVVFILLLIELQRSNKIGRYPASSKENVYGQICTDVSTVIYAIYNKVGISEESAVDMTESVLGYLEHLETLETNQEGYYLAVTKLATNRALGKPDLTTSVGSDKYSFVFHICMQTTKQSQKAFRGLKRKFKIL